MENNENESYEKSTTEETPFSNNGYEENSGVSFGDSEYFSNQFKIYSELEYKRRKIKSVAAVNGIPLIIIFGISQFWAESYFFLASKFGISRTSAYNFATEPGAVQILQIVLSVLMFTLPFIISNKISKKSVSETVPFKRVKARYILPLFSLGLAFCFFSSVMTSFSAEIFDYFGVRYDVDFGENPSGVFGIILSLIATAIIPALVEEFAFRGIVLGKLLPFGEAFAIVTSALIFGVMHGNFEQMPFAALVGLILGYIRVKTDSLWIVILIHFSNNFISVINDYLSEVVGSSLLSVIYFGLICVFFVLGIISIVYLSLNKEFNAYSLKESEEKIEEKTKYKWFFFSPFIIIFLILYILKSVSYFFL